MLSSSRAPGVDAPARAIGPAALIASAVLVVYGQAVTFDFVWDDHHFIVGNDAIKSLANIPAFFGQEVDGLYRPLRTTLYAVAYALFGLHPAPYHAMGLVLHTAGSLLVWAILRQCGAAPPAALFGALAFALHPVHLENFVFVTSAFDLPGVLCVLIALWLELGASGSGLRRIASTIVFGLGLLCAENAAVYPLLWALVTRLAAPPRAPQGSSAYALTLLLICAAYALVRTLVVGRIARPPAAAPDYWAVQAAMMVVYLHYWRLLLLPYPLSPVHPVAALARSFCGICALAGLLSAALMIVAVRLRRAVPLAAVGVLWFYAALLPNSNLIPTGTLVAERYLYLPSVGFAFLAAALLSEGYLRPPFAAAALVALAALSAYQTPMWRDAEALWKQAIAVAPRSETAWGNLAAFYQERGRTQGSIEVYRHMLRAGIMVDRAQAELAAFAIDAGDYATAERTLSALAGRSADDANVAVNLVIARCQLGRPGWPDDAERALRRFPSAFLYEQVGNCWARRGDAERAVAAFSKALELAPDRAAIRGKIELLRRQHGETGGAPESAR
jgi:tetratricopeptide (TPR) repeat protein